MAKKIPIEQLITLYNRMDLHAARSTERKILVQEFSFAFGVSGSTVRRQLREHICISTETRSDINTPRALPEMEMLMYCRIIIALKVRTSNKKNRHLSTLDCIKIIENHGVETEQGLIQAPIGSLKKTTINRYLRQWGYTPTAMKVEPIVVRFEAEKTNDCWQFDFSPSDLKRFSKHDEQKLFIASVTDDKSSVLYAEYILADGEDAITALKFLFNAMSAKKMKGVSFQGIPKMLYTDNGPFAKSTIFKRALEALGIEFKTHLPKGKDGRRTTARSKGKIERTNRTVKDSFETLFHLHQPHNLEQANEWLQNYLKQYNEMPHRSGDGSRTQIWKQFLPDEGFREMCSWDKFCQFVREPEIRLVNSEACIYIKNIKFQLIPNMAGSKVTVLFGIFDNELHVEFKDKKYGPFYPSNGPIPLHKFKKFAKSAQEKQADEIHQLAKDLSVPLSVMTGKKEDQIISSLRSAHMVKEDIVSIPFEENKPRFFKDRIEAKKAISHYLNRPLAEINVNQLTYINQVINDSLNKEIVLSKIKHYFTLTLCQVGNEEM